MDFQVTNRLYIVCGATSGFGRAIAELLLNEGANVICVGRRAELLQEITSKYNNAEVLAGDLSKGDTLDQLMSLLGDRFISGILINGGGPPAAGAMEATIDQWDEAYQNVVRWKVDLTKRVVPKMIDQSFGRIAFIESRSVKEPVPNLVLSNAFRMAIVGFVKTLATEIAPNGVTVNIIGPGMHDTPAMQRLYKKKSEMEGITIDQAKQSFINGIPVGRLGEANEIAVLALWLMSPLSGFVTGQTVLHDGGSVQGVFG